MVIAAAALVLVLAIFIQSTVEVKLLDDVGAEGEAKVWANLIDDRFEFDTNPTEQLVFSNPSMDVGDPQYRATVEALARDLRLLSAVGAVTTYYDNRNPDMVSADGSAVLATVELLDDSDQSIDTILEAVRLAGEEADGFEIGIAGNATIERQVEDIMEEDFGRIMLVTMVLGLLILLIAFRALVAAVIPLVLAIGAIFSAIGAAALVSHGYALAGSYEEMILLMGLADGIDYSLFILSRFRSEREAGRTKLDAISVASNTTGRAVFYAGVTVVLSLVGLMMTNNPIFISMALGAVIVVLIAIVGSLTLLPAMLSVLGNHINRLRVPFPGRGGERWRFLGCDHR